MTGRQQLISLPPLETAVIVRFAHGQQQRQIGRELGLNENTVKAIGLGLIPGDCALTPIPQGGSHVR